MNRIYLRKLKRKDAPLMLEWMQDPSIACFFRFDAQSMTVEDCEKFIESIDDDSGSKHYAIVNEEDEYLGTISLKNIDYQKQEAEYAISTRKKAHGTGVAMSATKAVLRIAFEELKLKRVYLNVLKENRRANAFYRKVGFQFDYCDENAFEIRGKKKSLNWYYFTNNCFKLSDK